jgi:hypothetical protein
MALQTVRGTPRATGWLQIGLGGIAGFVGGAVAGAAVFQSVVVALLGGVGGTVCGLITALKRIEGDVEDGDD